MEDSGDELELGVSSPDEPEPVKISPEPASRPSFLPIKMLKFELEPIISPEPEPRLAPPLS